MTRPIEMVCEACGAHSPDWGMCLAKGLGAWRGHTWVKIPECGACEDTGYEAGMAPYYCTFCKAGFKIAAEQMKAGMNPWDHDGHEESDEDKRRYADWGVPSRGEE